MCTSKLTTFVLTAVALLVAQGASAAEIDVNLDFDLSNSNLGSGSNGFVMGWGTPYIAFPEIQPVAGDSVVVNVNFVNGSTNSPESLTVTDLGTAIGQGIFATLGAADGTSVTADTANAFNFEGVTGSLLTNPVTGTSHSTGAGVGSTIITHLAGEPLTTTSFSFTGLEWTIDFSNLTYNSGGGFDAVTVNLGADQISTVPEPATLSLLGLGLAGIGIMRRRKAS